MLKIVDFKLPKNIFGMDINLKLLAQARHIYAERSHVGLRNTKTRSEVNRTTKKVYKQKGTGGARHGSRRANLFVGGGIIFGPRPLRRVLELSQGMKQAARIAAFSAKSKDKEVVVVSGITGIAKTKEVAEFLRKIAKASGPEGLAPLQRSSSSGGRPGGRFTFLLSESSKEALKFLRNLVNVRTVNYTEANALDILNGGMLVIDEAVFEAKKEEVISKKKGVKKTSA